MYFSKIRLRHHLELEKIARLLKENHYHHHQTIWQLFKSKNGQRDFLYREENPEWPCFYTLSHRQPQDHLDIWDIQIKEFAPKLHIGQPLAFSLRANPLRTKDQFDENGKRRRMRHDVVMNAKTEYKNQALEPPPLGELMQEAGEKWLRARMLRHGFEVQQLRVDGYQQHRLFKQKGQKPIQLSTLDFDGILTVTHIENFLTTLHKGIGSARSFGCGMLLIRRV